MSKPMLVTLPFVLLLLDYWPLRRFEKPSSLKLKGKSRSSEDRQSILRHLILEKVPLLVLSAISSIVTFLAQQYALGGTEQLPISSRVNNAFVTYVTYIWQMLYPLRLAVFYPHPENRLPLWEVIMAFSILVAITAGAFGVRKKWPYFVTGWLWYLGMLAPVIGVLQVGWQGRADRYTYLPEIGLYVLATWAVADFSASWRRQREILAIGAAVVIAALGWQAWIQTSYWRDSETLWTHTLAATENNDVAQNNLGIVLLRNGKLDEAISSVSSGCESPARECDRPTTISPKAFLQKGQVAEDVSLSQIVGNSADNAEARNILGTVLIQQGRVREAIAQWQETLATEPETETQRAISPGCLQPVRKHLFETVQRQFNWQSRHFTTLRRQNPPIFAHFGSRLRRE
jgi:hypothetical protein